MKSRGPGPQGVELTSGSLFNARANAHRAARPQRRKGAGALLPRPAAVFLNQQVVDLQLLAITENEVGPDSQQPAAHQETRNHAVYYVYIARTSDAAR